MKFVISELNKKNVFVSLFNIIKCNTTNISLVFKHDLLFIQGMDKSHISLFNVDIQKNWFTSYDYDGEGDKNANDEFIICLDTNTFYNIINNVTKNQSIIIETNKDNDYININLLDTDYKVKEEYNKSYKLPLIENEYEFLNIPEIDYECEFLINSKKICDITNQMQIFGSDIKIQCCEDFIEFTSNGTSGEMSVNIITDDLDEFTIEVDKNFMFTYNLNYLNKMCLTKNLSDKIYFKLSNDCPLKIKYDLDDENIDINFYVSPKLDMD
jgi:proliferating cell nuclear antigen PCNA